MNYLVTGISRGIGLELAWQILENGHRVLGVSRRPGESAGLRALLSRFPDRLRILDADISASDAPSRLHAELKDGPFPDVIIHNAGIYPEGDGREDFEQGFLINSIAPWMITRALLPLLRRKIRNSTGFPLTPRHSPQGG